jgi:SAM-dependent MidA family methyltransferase
MEVPEFTLVEYGAGTGLLCRDMLDYLHPHIQPGYKLNYFMIERSLSMREKQKTIVPSSVQWVEEIQDMETFTGCVISNEVVDNFPVHLLPRLLSRQRSPAERVSHVSVTA